MTMITPIAPAGADASAASPLSARNGASFGALLRGGLGQVEAKLANAEQSATQFAVDNSVPLHQVTIAMEEARFSVELMMQVRGHLLEAYQDVMRTQL